MSKYQKYDSDQIRKFLNAAFPSTSDLDAFCQYHYDSLRSHFGVKTSKQEMITAIFDHFPDDQSVKLFLVSVRGHLKDRNKGDLWEQFAPFTKQIETPDKASNSEHSQPAKSPGNTHRKLRENVALYIGLLVLSSSFLSLVTAIYVRAVEPSPVDISQLIGIQSTCVTESFNNEATGWSISSPPPTFREYRDGKYHMFAQDTSFLFHWARSPKGPYNDYLVQVDISWADTAYIGKEYGIVFDMTKQESNGQLMYYLFNINTETRTYILGRRSGGDWTPLVSEQSSDIRTGTSVNVLTVERRGSQIGLYINGKHQTSYYDILPRPAYVGINVIPHDFAGGKASFDNFIVCPINGGSDSKGDSAQ